MSEQLYCSLDLEFTGFDVTRDQILEVGFAFFRISDNSFEIVEEWSQVFKPSIEVHPKILGLTGITQAELDEAPLFSEHREFLQKKLGNAILVGHNPVMDVKFLESYGIKLSGKVIDTLELVQFLLPTHHSYNLENLMHYFGVAHEDSHRALGDSKTTIAILESLIRVFKGFDEALRNKIYEVLDRGQFPWAELLHCNLTHKEHAQYDSLKHLEYNDLAPLEFPKQKVWVDHLSEHHEARVALSCAGQENNFLIAVQSPLISLRLWRAGLGDALFAPSDVFNVKSFEWFASNATSEEELRFVLKVLVWLHTNWQTTTVLDLNISFFGGQYRQYITGAEMKLPDSKIVLCDYSTLSFYSQTRQFREHQLVICGLQDYERHISSGHDTKLTWSGLLYLLKNIYNPESGLGDINLKDHVIDALSGTDLFFALLGMLTKKYYGSETYINISRLAREQAYVYRRIQVASSNLADKLDVVRSKSQTNHLDRAINFLKEFFTEHQGRVRWIAMEEDNGTLCDQPLEINIEAQSVMGAFASVLVTETISTGQLLSYHCERIGLSTQLSDIPNIAKNEFNLTSLEVISALDHSGLNRIITSANFPVVLVMPSPIEVKKFYDSHYQEIKQHATIYAQGYSGGLNKMFRNFGLRERSLLVVTADYIAKHHSKIVAHTILFNDLPIVDIKHPYISALINHWKPKFPNILELLQIAKVASVLKKLNQPYEARIVLATNNPIPFDVKK